MGDWRVFRKEVIWYAREDPTVESERDDTEKINGSCFSAKDGSGAGDIALDFPFAWLWSFCGDTKEET